MSRMTSLSTGLLVAVVGCTSATHSLQRDYAARDSKLSEAWNSSAQRCPDYSTLRAEQFLKAYECHYDIWWDAVLSYAPPDEMSIYTEYLKFEYQLAQALAAGQIDSNEAQYASRESNARMTQAVNSIRQQKFGQARSIDQQRAQALMATGTALMQSGTSTPDGQGIGGQPGRTGFLTNETSSGFTKVCYYDVLGDTMTLNVSSASLCPLTAPFTMP